MPDLFKLYKSSNKTKKFDVYVVNPHTDRIKKISFGAKGYEDYTIHHDKTRRKRYIERHSNDNLDDPLSPGFWSMNVLWSSSTNINTNLKSTIRKFNKLCRSL